MPRPQQRIHPSATVAVAVSSALLASATLAGTSAAKGRTVRLARTIVVNQQIPDLRPNGDFGRLSTSTRLGGKFNRFKVVDVNLGLMVRSPSFPDNPYCCVNELLPVLDPPGGGEAHFGEIASGDTVGSSWGDGTSFLTLDDESPNGLSDDLPPADPAEAKPGVLYPPYAGSAKPSGVPMTWVEGGPMAGRWTLKVNDTLLGPDGAPTVSTLLAWRLEVKGRRVKRG
jgi:hypothetical protein